MKVLLSAFKSFNNASNNYSMEVLKYINNVDKIVIDVLYDECYKIISSCNLDDYDLVISLGEARSREELTLEIQAKNISSCSISDNNGVYKKDCVIIDGGKDVLNTGVNVNRLSDMIKFSYDAGKYVCNNLYYHLLYNYPDKSLFIHIPNCYDNEDEYVRYAKIIENIIKVILC